MTPITAPGIYFDVPSADYFADPFPEPSLTQSIAKILIEQSPAHARIAHPRLNGGIVEPEDYDKARAIGNAVHAYTLGRGKDVAVLDFDSFRSKDAQTARDAAFTAGQVPILRAHHEAAEAMTAALRDQLDCHEARDCFTNGSAEVVIACNPSTLWFRSLVDWLRDDLLVVDDLKTTGGSVADHVLAAKAEADGWHVQAAMQEYILDELDPANAGRRKFRFVAIENTPPYAMNVVEMSEHWMTMGRKQLSYAIGMWDACIRTGKWPAYRQNVLHLEYPGFREQRWLTREIEHEERKQREPFNPDVLLAG